MSFWNLISSFLDHILVNHGRFNKKALQVVSLREVTYLTNQARYKEIKMKLLKIDLGYFLKKY